MNGAHDVPHTCGAAAHRDGRRGNRSERGGVGHDMPTTTRLPLLVVVIVVAISGCSSGAAPSSPPHQSSQSASPTAANEASAEPTTGIDHPTGTDRVVLRYEEGGGLM